MHLVMEDRRIAFRIKHAIVIVICIENTQRRGASRSINRMGFFLCSVFEQIRATFDESQTAQNEWKNQRRSPHQRLRRQMFAVMCNTMVVFAECLCVKLACKYKERQRNQCTCVLNFKELNHIIASI